MTGFRSVAIGALAVLALVGVTTDRAMAVPVDPIFVLGPNLNDNDPFPNSIKVDIGGGIIVTSEALAKCDVTGGQGGARDCRWSDGNASGDYSGAFGVTFTDAKSGKWTFDPALVVGANPLKYPAFMAIKGGNDFLLVKLGNSFAGNWSTAGLSVGQGNQPNVSHLSFYNGLSPVPLPAAAWLLLSGIGALGVMAHRRRSAA